MSNPMMYVATMAVVTYLIRVLPLTLFRKPIQNIYIQSFLYYVPYVTLAVMTSYTSTSCRTFSSYYWYFYGMEGT